MRRILFLALLPTPLLSTALLSTALLSTAVAAQSVQPGNWNVKSTAIELVVPGAPGFMLRMMRGRSRTEHKCLAPDQAKAGIGALFVPDAKAKCTVERAQIADGRIEHVMACPQKDGPPMRIVRAGTYGQSNFAARMTMTGTTKKGPMRIVAGQTATRTGPACRM